LHVEPRSKAARWEAGSILLSQDASVTLRGPRDRVFAKHR